MVLQRFLSRLMWGGMAPLLCLALLMLGLHVLQFKTELERQGSALLKEAVRNLEVDLASRRSSLSVLAASPLLDAPEPTADLHRELTAFARQFGGQVLLAGPTLQMLLHTAVALGEALPALPRPRSKSAVEAVQAGKGPAMGDMFQGPLVQRPLVAMAVPVQRDGREQRVLLSTVEVRHLQEVLQRTALPAGWTLELRDGGEQIMAHLGQQTGPIDASALPWGAMFFQQRLDAAPWTLSLMIDAKVRHGQALRNAMWLMAATLTALALAFAGSRQAARQLAQGLTAMASKDSSGEQMPRQDLQNQPAQAAIQAAERALQLQAARAQAIVAHAADAIITCDRDFRITSVNAAALRMWGVSSSLLVGTHALQWVPARHQAVFLAWTVGLKAEAGPAPAVHRRILMKVVVRQGQGAGKKQELVVEAQTSRVESGDQGFYVVVLRDMSELVRARRALEQSASQLRHLIDRMNTVQEDERKRISRDLHDDLQQRLAVAELYLSFLLKDAQAGQIVQVAQVQEVRNALRETIAATRRIVRDLRPPELEDLGLAAALEGLVQTFSPSLEGGCEIQVRGDHEPAPAVASCLYRVTQEALNNIRKHAQAHSARVGLDLSSATEVTLEVEDDGVGVQQVRDEQDAHGHHGNSSGISYRGGRDGLSGVGMLGMAERLRTVGGTLDVLSGPAGGTLLRAAVPRPLLETATARPSA